MSYYQKIWLNNSLKMVIQEKNTTISHYTPETLKKGRETMKRKEKEEEEEEGIEEEIGEADKKIMMKEEATENIETTEKETIAMRMEKRRKLYMLIKKQVKSQKIRKFLIKDKWNKIIVKFMLNIGQYTKKKA